MPEYKQIAGFFGGLNLLNRTDTLDDNQIASCKNLLVSEDALKLDTGYILEDPDIGSCVVKLVYSLLDEDGIKHSFLFTKTKVYKWISNAWTEVKDEAGLSLDDPTRAYPLVGSDLYQISAVTFSGSVNTVGNSQLIWTNGVDAVHKIYMSGGTWICSHVAGLTSVNVNSCKALAVWQDSVWALNTNESGTVIPYKIRWCVPTNEEQWDTATYSSAGYYDLLGKADEIYQAEVLGAYLIVYRSQSIWRGTWIGSYVQPVVFEEAIANEGVLGEQCVANINSWHCVVGKSNIYKYTGGLSLEPMGNMIHKRVYDDDGILDLDYTTYIRALHIKESDSIWLMFPVMDDVIGSYTYIMRYHIKYNAWTERRIDLLLTSMGMLHLEEDDTWGGANGRDGTWMLEGSVATGNEGEPIGPSRAWLSQTFKYDFPYIFFSAVDSGYQSYLIRYDYQQTKDGMTGTYGSTGDIRVTAGTGQDIPYEFITKNFAAGSTNFRMEHIQVYIAGTTGHVVTVYYSINDGISWSVLGTITLTQDENGQEEYQRYRLWGNISTENIMFKFAGQGGSVRFGAFALAYFLEPI